MALGRRAVERQGDFWVPTADLPRSPGHPFYEQLNAVLAGAGFDRFCQERCQPFYHAKLGRPSVPPGVYFRMLLVGYFEKLPSERQIAWRCADSLSPRAFLGLAPGDGSPDDSSLNRSRLRIDLETHQAVFDWVLKRLAEHELLKGQRLGIDASTLEANAAMRSIVRRETGQSYREFLTELAQASGLATLTATRPMSTATTMTRTYTPMLKRGATALTMIAMGRSTARIRIAPTKRASDQSGIKILIGTGWVIPGRVREPALNPRVTLTMTTIRTTPGRTFR